MYRGTTPGIVFRFNENTEIFQEVWITFSQDGEELFTKNLQDCIGVGTGNYLLLELSQEETLKMRAHLPLCVQIRYKLNDVERFGATREMVVNVNRILKEGMLA